MSLLWMDYEKEFHDLVDAAFEKERGENAAYFASLPPAIHKIVYRDTRYNIDFLYTAYMLKEDQIMRDYAVWLYQLMASVLKHKTGVDTVTYVVRHLSYIRNSLSATVSADKVAGLDRLLALAQDCIREAAAAPQTGERAPSRYEDEIGQYMDCLLHKNTRKTMQLIHQFTAGGIPLSDVYVEILAESMRRVGELWHTAQITVDTEHYCTSVTQMAMAQMYPLLFDSERRGRTLLCACPGTELHEMGARMVADLFESDGWDSIYLGAAVPEDAMLDAVRDNQPDLIALSVTMPQHLLACRDLTARIRQEFPQARIAVGGKAFESTHEMWKQWPVDFYTADARELLKQANAALNIKS